MNATKTVMALLAAAGLAVLATCAIRSAGQRDATDLPATIEVDASQVQRSVDRRLSGVNTLVWDAGLDSAPRLEQVTAADVGSLRYPGGSMSDTYHWASNTNQGSDQTLAHGSGDFATLNEKAASEAYITVDYGSGTPEEAAAWVAWANGSPDSTQVIGRDSRGRDWQDVGHWASLRAQPPLESDDGQNFLRKAHAGPYGWKYFEIGNEVYGDWENDLHGASGSGLPGRAHDPVTYGDLAAQFVTKMKQVDPAIRIGVVTTTSLRYSDDFCVQYCDNTLSVDSKRGGRHHGWTPLLLAQLAKNQIRPDFLIEHFYPQEPGKEDDAALLSSTSEWSKKAQILRQQLLDYWSGENVEGIELAATEINSVASKPGKQSASLVNALFYADSYAQMLQAGFTTGHWWCLYGPGYASGNSAPQLHGSQNFGSYSWISDGVSPPGTRVPPVNAPFPTYYTALQLVPWREPGSVLLQASSSSRQLAAYATRQADGKLSLLVINKNASVALPARVSLRHFDGASAAVSMSVYGLGEEASGQPASSSSLPSPGSATDHLFPPYSSTLMRFTPR